MTAYSAQQKGAIGEQTLVILAAGYCHSDSAEPLALADKRSDRWPCGVSQRLQRCCVGTIVRLVPLSDSVLSHV